MSRASASFERASRAGRRATLGPRARELGAELRRPSPPRARRAGGWPSAARAAGPVTSSASQARHLPVEAVGPPLREQRQRHDHDAHAVVVGARLEAVGEDRAPGRPASSGSGSRAASDRAVVVEQVGLAHREELRRGAAVPHATSSRTSARRIPRAEMRRRRTRRHGLVSGEDVAPAFALLELLEAAGAARRSLRQNAGHAACRCVDGSHSPSTSACRTNSSRERRPGRSARTARGGAG